MTRIIVALLTLLAASIAPPAADAGTGLPPLDPAGFFLTSPGSPDAFGRLVDVSGSRVLVANDTQVFAYDVATDAWESGPAGLDLLAGLGAVEVRSIALNGTLAQIAFGDSSGNDANHTFSFDGITWSPLVLDTTPTPDGVVVASAPGATRITASSHPGPFNLPETTLSVGMAGSAAPPVEITWPFERIVNLAVAPSMTGGSSLKFVLVTENAPSRHLRFVTGDANGLTDHGVVENGKVADSYGDALDATTVHVVLGSPALLGGQARFYQDQGTSLFNVSGVTSLVAGDRLGQAVAVDDDLSVVASAWSNSVLFGGQEIGQLDLRRTTNGYLTTTREYHFDPDADAALPRGFGQAVSLDGTLLAVGSPGNGLADGRVLVRPLPPTSAFAQLGDGFPFPLLGSALYGSTIPGAPIVLAAPPSIAPEGFPLLVLGFSELNMPLQGGVLVPSLDAVLPLSQNPNGTYGLSTTWPDMPGPAIGFTVYGQTWAQDSTAPFGWLSTKAWSATQYATL